MDVVAAVARVLVLDPVSGDVDVLTAGLADIAGLRRWLDGREVAVHGGLQALATVTPSLLPEVTAAEATGTSLRDASRVADRVATADQLPELADALAAGRVSGAHVDALTAGLRSLEPGERRVLAGHGERLARLAESMPADDFHRHVATTARQIRADGGMSRLERQRRDVRCRTWVDARSGMVHLSGRFDPVTGASLINRVDRRVDSLFHDRTPPLCPTDPLEKQGFLRGHALLDLLTVDPAPTRAGPAGASATASACGGIAAPGRIDMTITLDARTFLHGEHEHSRIDCGIPGLELPLDTIRRLACFADITAMLLDDDGVVLKHGRTRRLASQPQRRALRAMYRWCAIPGCRVPVATTTPHHTIEWTGEHGPTDIDHLVPVCKHHHTRIHTDGWRLSLAPDRRLTITFPDGTTMTTGPPKEQWT